MKNILWLLSIAILSSLAFKTQDQRIITGKVTAASDSSVLPGVIITLKGTSTVTTTDQGGNYQITVPPTGGTLVFNFIGMQSKEVIIGTTNIINVQLTDDAVSLQEVVVVGYSSQRKLSLTGAVAGISGKSKRQGGSMQKVAHHQPKKPYYTSSNTSEEYKGVEENIFYETLKNPLSTFSIDVDAASYSNIRRFINGGQHPPKDAVRIEEMINYFSYGYEQPQDEHPFAVHTEVSAAPWNSNHKLVQIGLQGKKIQTASLPPSNLVFLIDVSGSMQDENKLPLLKSSLRMLVEELRPQDHVAMVVYAGAAGLVLEPTSGKEKKKISDAIDQLQAGGSTAGGEGITLAYRVAKEHFKQEGNNRIILATDGDFNVGDSSDEAMEKLIEEKRKDGIFLTVLGYGMGNYKDSKMEILADKGNGNYAYIDNFTEARKVLVTEFGGTLFTIAKDVKLQLEFNPVKVKAYRLIGYENRVLKNEDFNNDQKDAGELGAGHTVTALYEIIPAGVNSEFISVDELKYQKTNIDPKAFHSEELMTIKLRYKKPNKLVSTLIVHPVTDKNIALDKTTDNFRWAASVAAFGMLLRESSYVKNYHYDNVIQLAQSAKGDDTEGYRAEFINMVKSLGLITSKR
jgi:Ca-activated chloride channel family protein